MSTRAAINILGSTGTIIDITSLGLDSISAEHPEIGQYLIYGTLGMAPPPEGWGYVVNQVDSSKTVAISFADGQLSVSVTQAGEPVDLQHSITLHVAVESAPPVAFQAPPPLIHDVVELVAQRLADLRSAADYVIAPLQDAVDLGEATPEEEAQLLAWKRYRVALNRVPQQAGYPGTIDWPPEPA